MDPLSALSLAGTVVQFVDFGCKLLAEGRQIYQSSSGRLNTNEEIELITNDLQTLVKKLRDSFAAQTSSTYVTELLLSQRKSFRN
jgi:hypothetical protein